MAEHVWSRSRVYEGSNGTKIVNPPVVDLAVLIAQDYARRHVAPLCLQCGGVVSRQLRICTECAAPWLPPGRHCAWPRRHETWRQINRGYWVIASLFIFAWMIILASMLVMFD
jgi:hypothetical protein